MLEIEYYRTSSTGRQLRRQLLQIADGWTISNGEEVGTGPASLRGYDGGWHWGDTVFATRKAAERNLAQNRWHLEGQEPLPSATRNRPRASRTDGLVGVEVRLTEVQRLAIDTEAERLGVSRTAAVAKWADLLAKKQARRNRQATVK